MRWSVAHLATVSVLIVAFAGALAGEEVGNLPQVQESRLKAGYVYSLTLFVEWPPDVFSRADSPLSICVSGEDSFADLLEELIGQKKPGGRALSVVRLRTDEPRGCHMLFLAASRQWQLAKIQERVGNGSVLTVGEGKDFAERGGVVGLVMDEDRVRLQINVKTAERARLKISSRLLSIAHLVYELPGAERK
jgi:hypothetical protein